MGVIGMPRSGTSLAARMLNLLGVHLGPEEHMLEPTARSNPKGYWEQREINALNDAILHTFGGSFERPPELPPGWERDPALDPLRARARRLIEDYFGGSPLWGWKDPRNSLTQPFWRELVPEMGFVLCVRAPEDVATSWQGLYPANAPDWDELLGVWLQYNAAALASSSGAPRLVVPYDRLLRQPGVEAARLAGFLTNLGWPPAEEQIALAAASVDDSLGHHRTAMAESLGDARVPVQTRALYALLDALADDARPERAAAVEALAEALWVGYREAHSPSSGREAAAPGARRGLRALAADVFRRPPARGPQQDMDPESIRGSLDGPEEGALRNRNDLWVWGRVLFPGAATARVLVSIGEAPPLRARLGVPRPDVAALPEIARGHRDAPVAGFELLVPPRLLPAGADAVRVAVTAMGTDGSTVEFPARMVGLEGPLPSTERDPPREAGLRERVLAAAPLGLAGSAPGSGVLAFTRALHAEGAREQLLALVDGNPAETRPITVAAAMDRPLRDRFEMAGATVHTALPIPRDSPERYEARLAELAAWIGTVAPRGVLAQGLDSFPAVDLAARLELPCVWLLHEAFDPATWWIRRALAGPEYEYARERAELALRGAAAIAFPTRAVAGLYDGYVEAGRTSISPPGIDMDAIERFRAGFEPGPARDALGVPRDATLVLCPGRVVRPEDKVQLFQALVELRGRHPDAHVLLPGTADASAERLELLETYAEAGLRPVLHMPVGSGGHHLYAIADVVLVESDPADLPFAALAGMAFEKRVVASRLGGLEETIEHGVHGWLWEPNDLGELIEALDLALSAGPDEARRVGAAAAARVRERHDARAHAGAIERLLAATPILRTQ